MTGTAARWGKQVLVHSPVLVAAAAVAIWAPPAVAIAAWAACRLAYVLYVGVSLHREHEGRALSREVGPEEAWRRFRARASILMDLDAAAFGALCVATRGTLDLPGPSAAWIAVGLVLVVGGLAVKAWAAAALPEGAYYWRGSFLPNEVGPLVKRGPYRWLADPMYTVGYAPTYGVALVLASTAGLVASAASQVLILSMNALVERRATVRHEERRAEI
jgi:protein-S-isoprenylcysteine O-methyltransferase Ste14